MSKTFPVSAGRRDCECLACRVWLVLTKSEAVRENGNAVDLAEALATLAGRLVKEGPPPLRGMMLERVSDSLQAAAAAERRSAGETA